MTSVFLPWRIPWIEEPSRVTWPWGRKGLGMTERWTLSLSYKIYAELLTLKKGKPNEPNYCYCCSAAKTCLTLCNTMDYGIPSSSGLHYLLEFAQTHVHGVSDAISSPVTPLSFCLQSFPASGSFPWVSSSHQVVKVLELQLQQQSFQCIFRGWFPLGLTSSVSLLSKGLSRIFSNTTVQKH